jgi:uncharacterized protein (TIGR02246 family)
VEAPTHPTHEVRPGDDTGIDRDRLAFETALRSGDASAAADSYADDATLLAPMADLVQGRSAIERFWRSGLDAGIQDVRLDVLALERRGDVVVEIGAYALRLASEVGATVVDRGKYLTVLRVDADGRWRRTAEMFSPDGLPAGTTSQGASTP